MKFLTTFIAICAIFSPLTSALADRTTGIASEAILSLLYEETLTTPERSVWLNLLQTDSLYQPLDADLTALANSNTLNSPTISGTPTLSAPLSKANGGTGTATPALVAGTNVTITGSWPNQTINASGSGGGSGTPGGADTQVQFNAASAFAGLPSFTADTTTGAVSHNFSNTADVPTSGVLLNNTTASTSTVSQFSPAIQWTGSGWKTNSTAGSQVTDFRMYVKTSNGTTAPNAALTFSTRTNGGAWAEVGSIGSTGNMGITNNIFAGADGTIGWTGRSRITANSDTTLVFKTSTGTDAPITVGDATLSGNLKVGSGANGSNIARIKQGRAVLVGGTVTISDTTTTANSNIQVTSQVDGGTPGWLRISARTAATSFTITSSSNTDTSTVAYLITE